MGIRIRVYPQGHFGYNPRMNMNPHGGYGGYAPTGMTGYNTMHGRRRRPNFAMGMANFGGAFLGSMARPMGYPRPYMPMGRVAPYGYGAAAAWNAPGLVGHRPYVPVGYGYPAAYPSAPYASMGPWGMSYLGRRPC